MSDNATEGVKNKKKFSGVIDVGWSIKNIKRSNAGATSQVPHAFFFLIDDENSNRSAVRRVNARRPLPGIWSDVCTRFIDSSSSGVNDLHFKTSKYSRLSANGNQVVRKSTWF